MKSLTPAAACSRDDDGVVSGVFQRDEGKTTELKFMKPFKCYMNEVHTISRSLQGEEGVELCQ